MTESLTERFAHKIKTAEELHAILDVSKTGIEACMEAARTALAAPLAEYLGPKAP